MENKEYDNILFIESKIIGSLSLILLLFLLYKQFSSKEDKTILLFKIKIELIISCMLYPIGFLFPVKSTSGPSFCTFQTFVLTFSNYSALMLTTAIPFITYKILLNPLFIDNNPLLSLIITSLVCWGIGLLISIIFICIFEAKYSEYVCWYDDRASYGATGINLAIMILFIVITIILKWKIKKFLDEFQFEHSENQFKIFNKFFYLIGLAVITIVLNEINYRWFLFLNITLFYFFSVLNLALDCIFYVFVSYVFCFNKEMLPCLSRQAENLNRFRNSDDRSIGLIEDKNNLN